MKEKKLIPKRRFKEFQNTCAWEQRKLGELATIKDSARIPNSLWTDIGVPYLRSSDFRNNTVSGDLYISKETFEMYSAKTGSPECGDVLFSSGGKIGITYLKTDNSPVYVQGGSVLYVKTSERTKLNGRFLSIYFETPSMKKYIENASTGITIKHFVLKPANSAPVTFPIKDEQKKIGQYFKHLDEMIALQQNKIDKTKALKSAYLAEMFPAEGKRVPKRRFSGFTDEWESKQIIDLGIVKTGSTPPTNNKENYSESGMIWVTPTDIESNITKDTAKKLSAAGAKLSVVVPPKTILITSIASIGKNTMVTEYAGFNQQINSLSPNEEYDSYFLLTQSYYWSKKMKQIAGSGTMQIVNKRMFSEINTQVPKLEEQKKIGLLFKQIDDIITTHQQKLKKLKATKQAYLNEMFV